MKNLWQQVGEKIEMLLEWRWWKLVEATKTKTPNDLPAQIADLEQRLSACSAGQILKFDAFYRRQRYKAFQPEFWLVAKIISSNFADIEFATLTGFLVLSGRQTFNQILRSPVGLATPASCN